MNSLLLFFALPVSVSILSIILETIIHSPIKIAGIAFSILLIVTFLAADETFLIFTILYTLLSYITAWLTRQWCQSQMVIQDNSREKTIEELIQNSNIENNYGPLQENEYNRYRGRRLGLRNMNKY